MNWNTVLTMNEYCLSLKFTIIYSFGYALMHSDKLNFNYVFEMEESLLSIAFK